MNYALHQALRLTLEEGLEARWKRHWENHLLLAGRLEELGMTLTAQEGHRLPQLNAVAVPAGHDDAEIRRRLLNDFSIEIGAGLGPLKGKTMRIGLMGESSSAENVERLVDALASIINK
jgi:alanine-glyoxylate transaminase/serine-glyoxylate transaminase/serine-pyruvate transaminase